MLKDVILVEFLLGRCGTSLVMGLLDIAGVNVGPLDHNEDAVFNPGGCFETESLMKLAYTDMKQLSGFDSNIVTYEERSQEAEKYRDKFIEIIGNEYLGSCPIAIKDMNAALLPLVSNAKVLLTFRNENDQADSILKMWEKYGIHEKTREELCEWINTKKHWIRDMITASGCKSLELDFNDMLDNPVARSRDIYDFCEVPRVPVEKVLKWVCPKYSRSRT